MLPNQSSHDETPRIQSDETLFDAKQDRKFRLRLGVQSLEAKVADLGPLPVDQTNVPETQQAPIELQHEATVITMPTDRNADANLQEKRRMVEESYGLSEAA